MTVVDILIIITGGILVVSGVGLSVLVSYWKRRGMW